MVLGCEGDGNGARWWWVRRRQAGRGIREDERNGYESKTS